MQVAHLSCTKFLKIYFFCLPQVKKVKNVFSTFPDVGLPRCAFCFLCMNQHRSTHLKKIFEILACEIFHTRRIVAEFSDSISPKRWDLTIASGK